MEPIESQICDLLKVEIFQKAFGSGGRSGYVSALQILKDMTKWAGLPLSPKRNEKSHERKGSSARWTFIKCNQNKGGI